jgi:hypothetical protein
MLPFVAIDTLYGAMIGICLGQIVCLFFVTDMAESYRNITGRHNLQWAVGLVTA